MGEPKGSRAAKSTRGSLRKVDDTDGPSQPPTPLAAFIRDRAREKGWSIRQVAIRGGIPIATLRYYVRDNGGWDGISPLKPGLTQKIADALEVPASRVVEAIRASTGEADPMPGQLNAEQRAVAAAMADLDPDAQKRVTDLVTIVRDLLTDRPDEDS